MLKVVSDKALAFNATHREVDPAFRKTYLLTCLICRCRLRSVGQPMEEDSYQSAQIKRTSGRA